MGARSENQAKSFKVNRIFQLGLGIFVVIGLTSGELFPGWPTINLDGLSHSVVAAELRGGIRFFSRPPQLLESSTTFNGVSIPAAKYYFTIALPDGADNPLAKVVFQSQDSPDPINFELEKTEAFIGDRQQRGQTVPLNPTEFNRETGQLTVNFATPIAPGETVTIRLKPVKNPDVPGVYQFRLFAFPAGDKVQSMDLGIARFQFYRGGLM
ncbi:MAG: DUF2808 domain-containing protein [Synechocystis sp.]